ncbi:MAG: cytochrome oxidase biogenesis protein Surf12C [Bacillota bacterium]|nr:cytochrome oxidase biogenesis protein Surf12C [Bacillota bacterium]
MNMTHYMELLATNQPWNLLYYMVVPVALAESLVATEFFIVFRRQTKGALRAVNKVLGIAAGVYFTFAVFLRLLFTAIPGIEWRTWVDFVAVWSYLLGVVPLAGIALLELGVIARGKNDEEKMKLHFVLLTVFLIVAHVAMVFGMVNPEIVARAATGGMGGM